MTKSSSSLARSSLSLSIPWNSWPSRWKRKNPHVTARLAPWHEAGLGMMPSWPMQAHQGKQELPIRQAPPARQELLARPKLHDRHALLRKPDYHRQHLHRTPLHSQTQPQHTWVSRRHMGTTPRVARVRIRLRAAWGMVTIRDSTTHQVCRLLMVHRSVHQGHRLVRQCRLALSSTTRSHGGCQTSLLGWMPWSYASKRWVTTLSTTPASRRRVDGCYHPFIMIGTMVPTTPQQSYSDPDQQYWASLKLGGEIMST